MPQTTNNFTGDIDGTAASGHQRHHYLIESEAAEFLRLSPRTLQRHRPVGTGSPFVRAGRRVLYRVFIIPVKRPSDARQRACWRVTALARRHLIPIAQAAVYAAEMDIPTGEAR